VQQQKREQRQLPTAGNLRPPLAVHGLDRAKNPKIHHATPVRSNPHL
jgi:hypothetical protein